MEHRLRSLERHFTYRMASAVTGICESTLRTWTSQGRIRHLKMGAGRTCRVLFPESALVEFLDRHAVRPAQDVIEDLRGRVGV